MKKTLLVLVSIFLLVLMGCSSEGEDSQEDNYPSEDIELVVPYSEGGSTDTAARILVSAVNENLPGNKSVVINNQAGGGGTIGTSDVFNSEPDGYKLLLTTTSPLTVQPHLADTSYEYDSLQPIMKTLSIPQVLLVQADSPWDNFDEWLEYTKENPNEFTYAVSGTGTTAHLVMESLNDEADVETTIVPYEGGSQAIAAVVGGDVDGAVATLADMDTDELRALLSFGSKSEAYKDAPTLSEMDVDVDIDVNYGLFAPEELPEETFNVIHDAFQKALDDPEVEEKLKNAGISTSYLNAEDFHDELKKESEQFEKILKKIDLIK